VLEQVEEEEGPVADLLAVAGAGVEPDLVGLVPGKERIFKAA
jgi:hypothetical protein